jgi:hypothetical protein
MIPLRAGYLYRVEMTRLRLGGRRSLADAGVLAQLTDRIERVGPAVRRARGRMTPHQIAFSTPHPILGPLSQSEWHRWAFLHTDHHLRQFGL